MGELNENMGYKFTVEQPDQTLMIENDCENFGIRTIINTQINGCDDTCTNDPNNSHYYGH